MLNGITTTTWKDDQMTLDPITVAISALICATIWQQWNMYQVQQDLDEVINKHNEFVTTMLYALELEEVDGEYP
jgi:cell division protein FtsL